MAVVPPVLPGRLGSPDLTLRDDPRADPRLIAVLDAFGLAGTPAPPPLDRDAPLPALLEFLGAAEEGFSMMGDMTTAGAPTIDGVESHVEVIRGLDGNDVTLFVHRPMSVSGPVPAIVHLHGGGMVILEAAGAGYVRWRNELAATGLVVIGVEFRNGAGKLGPHPFPAGLNDCTAALQWVTDNRASLGISKVIVSGESGGGNLTLATALRANREGRIGQIDGVYAQCPYISNAYHRPDATLASLVENDGYFLGCDMMGIFSKLYSPDGAHDENPLAWPLFASTNDLRGLPPHVISVNQLDPLRDEGLLYFRKLLDAGVSAVSRTVNGTTHAADCVFRMAIPDVYLSTIRDIHGFATSL
jgi:acetyl esterase